MRAVMLFSAVVLFLPVPALAQTWTSTFVGPQGLAGNASSSGSVWTINGGGADVWDRTDSFQFLSTPAHDNSVITARIDDLQNTDTYAKAGVMVRTTLDASSAMAILDIRPGGQLEFMARTNAGDAVSFVSGEPFAFPAWLRLSWHEGSVRAWVSEDGVNWGFFANVGVTLPSSFNAGIAVTSHNMTTPATAHVDELALNDEEVPGWNSTDVGSVGLAGSAVENNGVWTVNGAGADIWGDSDGFQFVYRPTIASRRTFQARVLDLQSASAFAKAGIMIRTSLDSHAATVVLDVRPTGDIEFMMRAADGGQMQYLGGTTVSLPVWLALDWIPQTADYTSPARVTARVSRDGITWTPISPSSGITFSLPPQPGYFPLPPASMYHVGVIVSSHDASHTATAHFEGVSLFGQGQGSYDIGTAGLAGNTVNDPTLVDYPFIVEAAGADIWGTADSFHFFLFPPEPYGGGFNDRVDIHAANSFAKAGFMYRDGLNLSPSAAMVVLDVKPDGGVEFMARKCTGCAVTFIAGANVGVPAFLRLTHSNGTTFSAHATSADGSRSVDLGTVVVPMSTIVPGLAVTSHDPSQIAVGIFNNPPR